MGRESTPTVYGEPFEPLAGGVYAGYPERQTDAARAAARSARRYEDLNLYVAFYCEFDDFMMYDDGDDSLLAPLAAEFGPAVMGIVLAHEYGHAIQSRVGALDQFLADDLHRAAGRLLRRRLGRPGLPRRVAAAAARRRRRPRRTDRDARGARPGRHRPVRRRRTRIGVRPCRRLPGGVRQRCRSVAPSCSTSR